MDTALLRSRMRGHTAILASFSVPLRYFSFTTAPSLLGPPEIYSNIPPRLCQNPAAVELSPEALQESATAATKTDPFINLMGAEFNKTATMMKGYTENRSPTFLSSGNPCLDFFFHVVPDTPPKSIISRLQLAWDQDPLTALKLVCNLRGIRGTGKSDREGFYTSALWLHDRHPKTLAGNVEAVADFGYYKDLLEILFRVLEGAEARKLAKEMGEKWKAWESAKDSWKKVNKALSQQDKKDETTTTKDETTTSMEWWSSYAMRKMIRGRGDLKKQLIAARESFQKEQTLTREEKRIQRAKRVVERFNNDPVFQFLHERVSDLFAQRLRSDMEMLKSGSLNKISLAAKWCPSLDSSFDRITLLCETIAKKVFPREECQEYEGVEEAHYAYRVRDRMRKEVLVPLRKALQLPEVYMAAQDWGNLPYNRVASVAMKLYKKRFFEHDEERFREYLGRVKSGKAKIAAGALLPHQIISPFMPASPFYIDKGKDSDEEDDEVAELQWSRMVEDMAKIGTLKNCLAICDVSGSMYGTPLDVSVALGILVSELSEEPWKGKLITFSEKPELQQVKGETLKSKTEFVTRMEWDMNTDFQKVFDVILQVAEEGKLRPDEMIKRLFVFSDMEFDQASLNPWETDYEAIQRKFREKGYGECVPEIVFWNLRDSNATPVLANQRGVALVSGFSKNIMKMFMKDGGVIDPVTVMEAAIRGEEYQKLVVLD